MRRSMLAIAALLAACGPAKPPVVRTEVVRVPVAVVQPIDPALLREISVDRAPPACMRAGQAAYCNGQVAQDLDQCLRVVDEHNADKRAIRRQVTPAPSANP